MFLFDKTNYSTRQQKWRKINEENVAGEYGSSFMYYTWTVLSICIFTLQNNEVF